MKSRQTVVAVSSVVLGALAALPAGAMTLSYTTTGNGTQNTQAGSGAITAESDIGSDGYSHTFFGPADCSVGQCVVNPSTSSSTGYGFYDDFVFTVPQVLTNALVSTITLGSNAISGLQERIYAVNPAGGGTNPVPGVSALQGGVLQSWSAYSANGISILSIPTSVLSPGGTYVLEVRGNVTGSTGGTYTQSINFQPLPLPGALPLFATGLGLLGCLMALRVRRPMAIVPAA
jgi:hypothetical protein